jgi:7-cyano-7-deazaguanine synthase
LSLTSRREKVSALFFDFGQASADYELTSARQICRQFDVPLEAVSIPGLKHLFLGITPEPQVALGFFRAGAGPGNGGNCPRGLFGVAATYCVSAQIPALVTGMHAGDVDDALAMSDYLDSWSAAMRKLQKIEFKFDTPLLQKSKAEVVVIGAELGVPLEATRSCCEPTPIHCGTCKPCKERKAAFVAAGVVDKTAYSS